MARGTGSSTTLENLERMGRRTEKPVKRLLPCPTSLRHEAVEDDRPGTKWPKKKNQSAITTEDEFHL